MHRNSLAPEQPSLRVLLVPRLLSHGFSPEQVAGITRVPAALVWLIEDELRGGSPVAAAGAARASRVPPGQRTAGRRGAVRNPHRHAPTVRRLATLAAYALGGILTIAWHEPIMPLAVVAAALLSTHIPDSHRKDGSWT